MCGKYEGNILWKFCYLVHELGLIINFVTLYFTIRLIDFTAFCYLINYKMKLWALSFWQNSFNFEQRDWFTVKKEELQPGSKLVRKGLF